MIWQIFEICMCVDDIGRKIQTNADIYRKFVET